MRFNPRPRGEGDQHEPVVPLSRNVSIHALAGRATVTASSKPALRLRFNPRPRGEGDEGAYVILGGDYVSIHALAGRATTDILAEAGRVMFQSTPSRGGRRVKLLMPTLLISVSIHALAGRATPRARNSPSEHAFQSTPSRGGRRSGASQRGPSPSRFNPRPRGEGDGHCPPRPIGRLVSIHALAGRATALKRGQAARARFQSTPSRGGRRTVADDVRRPTIVSIHALAGRATSGAVVGGLLQQVSIHALAGRATAPRRQQTRGWLRFNPRPRGEGDLLLAAP